MRTIKRIFVHCSAGFGGVESMRAYWKSLGWKSDGYHIVIDLEGKPHYLNTYDKVTNGVLGYNIDSIHVCYIGGVKKDSKGVYRGFDTRTPEQKETLLKVLKELKECFPHSKILGHRDISPDKNLNGIVDSWERIKECPSFDAIPEYAEL